MAQPWLPQNPQLAHAGRPRYASELMAMGVGAMIAPGPGATGVIPQGGGCVGQQDAHVLGGSGRHGIGRGAGFLERVAPCFPLDADDLLHFFKGRFQVPVGDRPVLDAGPVQLPEKGLDAKVFLLDAGGIAVVVDRAPPDGGGQAVHLPCNRLLPVGSPEGPGFDPGVLVDEIPVHEFHFVIAEPVEGNALQPLEPDEMVFPLFQEENLHAAFGEDPGRHASPGAGTDDDNVRKA